MLNNLNKLGLALILITIAHGQPPQGKTPTQDIKEKSSGSPGPGNRKKGPFSPEEIAELKKAAIERKSGKPQIIQGENGVIIGNALPANIQLELKKQMGAIASGIGSGSSESPLFRVRNILSTYQSLIPSDIETRILQLESHGFLVDRMVEDPFGLGMNGDLPKTNIIELDGTPKEKPPSLQDAVQTLVVHGVIPSRREFLTEGGQNIFEGDRIQLAFQGLSFNARVERVEELRIVFRDRVTGDRAILPLHLGPQEELLQTTGNNGTPFLRPMPPVNPVEGRND